MCKVQVVAQGSSHKLKCHETLPAKIPHTEKATELSMNFETSRSRPLEGKLAIVTGASRGSSLVLYMVPWKSAEQCQDRW